MKKIRLTESQYIRLDNLINEGKNDLNGELSIQIQKVFMETINNATPGDTIYLMFGEASEEINWEKATVVAFDVTSKTNNGVIVDFLYSSEPLGLKEDLEYMITLDSLVIGRKSGKIKLIEHNKEKDTKQQKSINNFISSQAGSGKEDEVNEKENTELLDIFKKLVKTKKGRKFLKKPNKKGIENIFKDFKDSVSLDKIKGVFKRLKKAVDDEIFIADEKKAEEEVIKAVEKETKKNPKKEEPKQDPKEKQEQKKKKKQNAKKDSQEVKQKTQENYDAVSEKILKSMVFEPGWLGMDNAFFYPSGYIVMDSILKKYGLALKDTSYGDEKEKDEPKQTGTKVIQFKLGKLNGNLTPVGGKLDGNEGYKTVIQPKENYRGKIDFNTNEVELNIDGFDIILKIKENVKISDPLANKLKGIREKEIYECNIKMSKNGYNVKPTPTNTTRIQILKLEK